MSLGVLQSVLQNVPFRVLFLCCFGCAHNTSPKTFGATGRGTLKAFAQPQNGSAKRSPEGAGCRWRQGCGELGLRLVLQCLCALRFLFVGSPRCPVPVGCSGLVFRVAAPRCRLLFWVSAAWGSRPLPQSLCSLGPVSPRVPSAPLPCVLGSAALCAPSPRRSPAATCSHRPRGCAWRCRFGAAQTL